MSGQRAAQPPPGLQASGQTVDDAGSGLAVTLHLEDAPNYCFDLSKMAGAETLRRDFAQAVLAWSANERGGRRTSSVLGIKRALSSILRYLEELSGDQSFSRVEFIAEITPFHLRGYHTELLRLKSRTTVDDYFNRVRTLLRFATSTSDATRREINKRQGWSKPETQIERYSKRDFARIRDAARKAVEDAHARIHAAHLQALEHGLGNIQATAKGRALHEVMTTGKPQSKTGFRSLEALGPHNYHQLFVARRHLFLDGNEVLAAAVLMACHRGLNLSPIVMSGTPVEIDADIVQLDLDKPRRGPGHRFWPEIVTDNTDQNDQAATDVRMIAEATEPARTWLAHNHQPTQRLLIRWPLAANKPYFGVPSATHRKGVGSRSGTGSSWVPDGIRIDFQRLRRSVPHRGVAKEPTDHNPATYLHYVRTDPVALAEQQLEAARGIQAAMDRARIEVQSRMRKGQDSGESNDALIANCRDPELKPTTGMPCTTGYFSFLDCLDCENAATVSRLLPRQLAALAVLEELRDALGDVWERKFARRYYMLRAIIERHSSAERLAVADLVDAHRPSITVALRQEGPRG